MENEFLTLTKELKNKREFLRNNLKKEKTIENNFNKNNPTFLSSSLSSSSVLPSLNLSLISNYNEIKESITTIEHQQQRQQQQKQKNPLILSAGTVRERYRGLRKNEEKLIHNRHNRNFKKHSEVIKSMCDSKDSFPSEPLTSSMDSYKSEEIQQPQQEEQEEEQEEEIFLPPNSTIIDNLCYSKYCTDFGYKNEIVSAVKRELLRGYHVILRSNPIHNTSQYFTSKSNISDSNFPSIQSSLELFSQDDIRENKQILKSVFMSCISFTSQDIIPSINERMIDGKLIYEIIMIPKI